MLSAEMQNNAGKGNQVSKLFAESVPKQCRNSNASAVSKDVSHKLSDF